MRYFQKYYSTAILILFLCASFIMLFMVKHNNYRLQKELMRIEIIIEERSDILNTLNAEWAYITRSENLIELAAIHLPDMRISHISQMKDISSVIEDYWLYQDIQVASNTDYLRNKY